MYLFRGGSGTGANLTPREGRDTQGAPGTPPGLSCHESCHGRGWSKAQVIDTARLPPPLRALPDDPQQGGEAGHWSICPVTESGEVDQALLLEWARARRDVPEHRLTGLLRVAIVREQRVE